MRLTAGLLVLLAAVFGETGGPATGAPDAEVLVPEMVPLRQGDAPEWAEFAPLDPDSALIVSFEAAKNTSAATLEITQYDVRQEWLIRLNGVELGSLHRDELLMTVYRDVPAGTLVDGRNVLAIEPAGPEADDVKVGRIKLHDRNKDAVVSEAQVRITVVDTSTRTPLPSRITVVDEHGALRTVGAATTVSDDRRADHKAVRPGTIYTGSGDVTFGLPAGRFTLYASRGFEYGADSLHVVVSAGDEVERRLAISREVDTEGWAAMDTHVHTLTHSGHGDATEAERVLTLAGEGIELPVITDHNKNVDLGPMVRAMGYDRTMTPIVGNEYTTSVGHFNIFSVDEGAALPDPDVETWAGVQAELDAAGSPQIVILNHARDVHAGFRPFGRENFLASVGRIRGGETLPANAMEVVNSSAQQGDVMRLVKDWFGALNAGAFLTPVGSSDSHDVARFLVGQGRTYVKAGDDAPTDVNVEEVLESFGRGEVIASFGLMPMITVDGEYGPGNLVPTAEEVRVEASVRAPSWIEADRVILYMNGNPVREAAIASSGRGGRKWSGVWTVPLPSHDVYLAAVAVGPGETPPFWPIAKPYQAESPVWKPRVIGVTGAVWIDVDGDGRRTPARAYARRLVEGAGGDLETVTRLLSSYDEAVAAQAAAELYERGRILSTFDVATLPDDASDAVRAGFRSFLISSAP